MRRSLLCVALLFGCQGITFDLDSVGLAGNDVGGDATPMLDSADTPDAPARDTDPTDAPDTRRPDADAPDAPDADAPDAPDMNAPRCEIPHAIDTDRCNPTVTGVCPANGFCALAVAGAPPPELLCVERASEGTVDVGEPCTRAFDCLEGSTCVDWGLQEADPRPKGCARYCEIDTGRGCLANEFCTSASSQPPLAGIGWCTPQCDPYDKSSCGTGQTCNVDYNYPVSTCMPHFRCVESEDTVPEGDPCGPGRAIASCAEDLICYEVQVADFRCVSACQGDADCGGGTCQPPAGLWGLRFCQ